MKHLTIAIKFLFFFPQLKNKCVQNTSFKYRCNQPNNMFMRVSLTTFWQEDKKHSTVMSYWYYLLGTFVRLIFVLRFAKTILNIKSWKEILYTLRTAIIMNDILIYNSCTHKPGIFCNHDIKSSTHSIHLKSNLLWWYFLYIKCYFQAMHYTKFFFSTLF